VAWKLLPLPRINFLASRSTQVVQPAYRFLTFTVAAAIGFCGFAASASAALALPPTAPTPNGGDFQVVESCVASDGCNGTFTVVNNSGASDLAWYVFGFSVTNPNVVSDGTTQTGWTASTCPSCDGGPEFVYANTAGESTQPGDLANDVGPGQSSNLFTFNSFFEASSVDLSLVDAAGDATVLQFQAQDAPEPASLCILGTGLLGLLRVSRRRRVTG